MKMKDIFEIFKTFDIFQMSSPEEWLVCGLCSAKVIVDKGLKVWYWWW